VPLVGLGKLSAQMSAAERTHYREGDLGPGVPERQISSLPKVIKPQIWEISSHPHKAVRAGLHVDLRLGNPETGIAHSFVLPRRDTLPGPGESVKIIPTYDHSISYLDYTGPISTPYGKGTVLPGRRTQAEVYHAEPSDQPGTKIRFNLYEGTQPEEYAIRKDSSGHWYLHNKTQTRGRRADIPAEKPSFRETSVDQIDPPIRRKP